MEFADLQDHLNRISATAQIAWGLVSSGFAELDALLPSGGLRRGTLVEWLAAEPGSGTILCSLRGARAAMSGERPLVVVDHDGTFHPPGLRGLIDWHRVLLVRCRTLEETDWTTNQALRTSGVGAVLVRFDRDDERRLRRWQLSAERSGTIGLIVRHMGRQPEACFSDLRIAVSGTTGGDARRVRLQILRSRQGGPGAECEVRLDDDLQETTNSLPPASTFTTRRRATGT